MPPPTGTSNGREERGRQINGFEPCRPVNRAVPGPTLWAEMAAQAWHYGRAVPGTSTMLAGPGRAWAMLFRAMPGLAHRVSVKWKNIEAGQRTGTAGGLGHVRSKVCIYIYCVDSVVRILFGTRQV